MGRGSDLIYCRSRFQVPNISYRVRIKGVLKGGVMYTEDEAKEKWCAAGESGLAEKPEE